MGIEKSVVVLKRIYKLWFTKEEHDMSKCKLNIAGSQLVMDIEIAMKVFEMLTSVPLEKIDYDYIARADSSTGESQHLYYLRPISEDVRLEGLNAEDYAMWKLYTASRKEKK